MFTLPKPNVIASTDGYSVEVIGRVGLIYSEGSKTLQIDSEILSGPSGLVVYTGSIKNWDKPFDKDPLSADDKQRIVRNIKAAFNYRGFDIEVR